MDQNKLFDFSEEALVKQTVHDVYLIGIKLKYKFIDAVQNLKFENSPYVKHWCKFVKKYKTKQKEF